MKTILLILGIITLWFLIPLIKWINFMTLHNLWPVWKKKQRKKRWYTHLKKIINFLNGTAYRNKYFKAENIEYVFEHLQKQNYDNFTYYLFSICNYPVHVYHTSDNKITADILQNASVIKSCSFSQNEISEKDSKKNALYQIVSYCYNHPLSEDKHGLCPFIDCFINKHLASDIRTNPERLIVQEESGSEICYELKYKQQKYSSSIKLIKNGNKTIRYSHRYEEQKPIPEDILERHKRIIRYTTVALHQIHEIMYS